MNTATKNFLDTFNKIEKYFVTLNNTYRLPFYRLVDALALQHPVIAAYQMDLKHYGDLRNAIVHTYQKDKTIADVHEETAIHLERISNEIKKPSTAFDLFKCKVEICDISTPLKSILEKMYKDTFTHIPVYDGAAFIGILSENSISGWLSQQQGTLSIPELKVKDLYQKGFLSLEQQNEVCQFIPSTTDVYTIKVKFDEFIKEKKRLGALLITSSGKTNEKLLGIVTAWDLPRIRQII